MWSFPGTDTLPMFCLSRQLGGIRRDGNLVQLQGLFTPVGSWCSLDLAVPLYINRVASPPSTRWSHPSAPGTVSICSVHHQYSGSVSPFPCEHRGSASLRDASRSMVPGAEDVSGRPPNRSTEGLEGPDEWMVSCRDPLMFKSLNGWASPHSSRHATSAGISCSAKESLNQRRKCPEEPIAPGILL